MRAIQALSCYPNMALKQVKCKKAVEDDLCILNSCKHNHKLIFLRHDYLVGKIAKELKLWTEHYNHWGHMSLWKQDEYLEQRARDKVIKYKPLLNQLSSS